MTYLDLVNNVLRRLRETEVSTVAATSYSKLIGDLINDAKDLVENAWDWSALRTVITLTTSNGDYTYPLTGSGNKIKEFLVINDTSNVTMQYRSSNWFEKQFLLQTPLAVALASRERGETGGTSTPEYFEMANKYLSDAIAQDAGRHPEELIFYTP